MPTKCRPREPAQDRLHLPGRQAADLRRAGAGREGGIERIDVEAEIGGRVADDAADALGDRCRAALVHVLRGDDRDALADRPVVDVRLHRRADADLHHAARIDQPLLDRVIEHRAVRIALPEIVRPGVDMGVEVHQRQRAAARCASARSSGSVIAVVAAQRDQMRERGRLLLDQREALRGYRRAQCAKSPMSARGSAAGSIHNAGMVAVDQHAARLSDRGRPEARAAAVGGADVERNAGNAERRARSRRAIPRKLGGSAKVGTSAMIGGIARRNGRPRPRPRRSSAAQRRRRRLRSSKCCRR